MKKLVLSLAVLFSVAMVSCGNSQKAEAVDSDTVEAAVVEEVATDSTDTVVAAEEVVAPVDSTVAQ